MKIKSIPIFLKSFSGAVFIIIIGIILILDSKKERSDLIRIDGKIESYQKEYKNYGKRNDGKYRFIKIDGYEKVFMLFTGKDSADFSPQFEMLDALKVGDEISLYYNENLFTKNDNVNRLVKFIDRGQENIFILGTRNETFAYMFIRIGGVLALFFLSLRISGLIV